MGQSAQVAAARLSRVVLADRLTSLKQITDRPSRVDTARRLLSLARRVFGERLGRA
ncbi:MAG: hypothetical protein ACRYHQ_23935 [Janthinobacterium lividum]